jgi:hypothetical protein
MSNCAAVPGFLTPHIRFPGKATGSQIRSSQNTVAASDRKRDPIVADVAIWNTIFMARRRGMGEARILEA